MPSKVPFPQPGSSIRISVTFPADIFNELNGLGVDLSDHVSEALDPDLKARRTAQTHP